MEWQEVYGQNQAVCGQGLEFAGASAAVGQNVTGFSANDDRFLALQKELKTKVCAEFFEHLNGNFAIRMKYQTQLSEKSEWYAGSWCYVSNTCSDLHGGQAIPDTKLAWKVAQTGHDIPLGDMEPEDIIEWGKAFGYDLETLIGFAYWHDQGTDSQKVSKDLLQRGIDSVQTTVLLAAPGSTAARQIVKNYPGHGYNLWEFKPSGTENAKPSQRWTAAGVDTPP